ncbi:uncharacterized protein LOC108102228 [Drosophila ficusphila]|uniref:uncharacterized protein LOC108102228 n=1 Tax=Drosophila ficusphila TaxID=30025 RepID=UPI0007E84B26|nr:uncharacterized protein LOC108102228 [Drosophila ficusphila]
MTSFLCVCTAGFFHLMNYVALSSKSSGVRGPDFPSLIVAIAAMDLIWDNCFIPRRFEIMPTIVKRIYELAVSFLLLEIAIHVFWKSVEQICFFLIAIILVGTGLVTRYHFEKYESYWVGSVTVPLSLLILSLASQATDHFHMLQDCYYLVHTKVQLRMDNAMKHMVRGTKKKMTNTEPTPRKHKDLAHKQRRGKSFVSQFHRSENPFFDQ